MASWVALMYNREVSFEANADVHAANSLHFRLLARRGSSQMSNCKNHYLQPSRFNVFLGHRFDGGNDGIGCEEDRDGCRDAMRDLDLWLLAYE